MSQWFQSQAADFYDTGYKSWSHGMTNVSTLAVSVPINLSIKLGFASLKGPRETFFVDALRVTISLSERMTDC